MLNKNDAKHVNGDASVLIGIYDWDYKIIGSFQIENYYLENFNEDSCTHFFLHNGGYSVQCRGLTSGTGASEYLVQLTVENCICWSI